MSNIPVSIPVNLQRINRHGVTCAFFVGLLILCGIAHSLAGSSIGLLADIPGANLPSRLLRNITGIQFIDANWYFPMAYLLLSSSA